MINIGLGEYAVSTDLNETIITHALGTCVALIIYCPIIKKAAMAHIVLPKRNAHHHNANRRAAYFADDIVQVLVAHFFEDSKCLKNSLQVTMVGGATSKNKSDVFKVGEINVSAVKILLKPFNLPFDDTETLGRYSRTVKIDVSTGKVNIKKQEMFL